MNVSVSYETAGSALVPLMDPAPFAAKEATSLDLAEPDALSERVENFEAQAAALLRLLEAVKAGRADTLMQANLMLSAGFSLLHDALAGLGPLDALRTPR